MKKRFLCASAAAVMLLCSACSDQTAPAKDNESTSAESTANDTAAYGSAVTVPEAKTDDQAENGAATIADSETETPDSIDNAEAETADSPSRADIAFETKEDSASAEDGTLLYASLCSYPVVTIEGNESAAEKINADILAEVDAVFADTAMRDYAKEDYEFLLSNGGSEYGFSNYYHDLDITVTRNDSNVISFLLTDSVYSGGAHGNYSFSGLNYNAKTGDLISFADLAENAESFHADTLAFLKDLITTDAYQEILFESAADDLEATLYQDETWYLSTGGLVFFSDPYALGAFAAGKIEFTIPYSDLTEMGLKEEYSYQENLTVKLQDENPILLDINGDGQEDSVQFYIQDRGTLAAEVYLIINGIDYAKENTDLFKLLSGDEYAYYRADCYLYDMDMTDDTIEIALYMENYDYVDEEASFGSTFFYRYDKDGTFSCIGMTRGSVADPTTEIPAVQ